MLKSLFQTFMTTFKMSTTTLSPAAVPAAATAAAPRVPIPANGVDYRGKIVLAPMVRSGELPSRLCALTYGADLVWGPETVDRAIVGTTRRINPRTSMVEFSRMSTNVARHVKNDPDFCPKESIIYRIDPVRERGKLIFQLGTADPELAVQATKVVAGDVAGIDVNAGCPKSFSTDGGMGAALLKTPDRLASILETLVREVGNVWKIGISVKIRLLAQPEDTEKLVTKLCGTGITGLTVHCRTTPMRPREAAIRDQLRMVAGVCRDAGVACLMNGDVKSRDQGLALMQEYGVDGAMIATAAESNFSCFRSAADSGGDGGRGLLPWRELVHEYMRNAMRCENKLANTKFMLHIIVPGKAKGAHEMKQSRSYEGFCRALEFDDLMDLAREADEAVGLNVKETPAVQKAKKQNNTAKAASGVARRLSTPNQRRSKSPEPIRKNTNNNDKSSSSSSSSLKSTDRSSSSTPPPPPTTTTETPPSKDMTTSLHQHDQAAPSQNTSAVSI